jgi:hypothetical protein
VGTLDALTAMERARITDPRCRSESSAGVVTRLGWIHAPTQVVFDLHFAVGADLIGQLPFRALGVKESAQACRNTRCQVICYPCWQSI